jgi:outer membrane phospholipase A
MNISSSEQSNRFKLDFMMPLKKAETKGSEKQVVKKGRSSITAIPTPDPKNIFNKIPEKINTEPEEKSENLSDSLCNSYKFVVNYGVFEPNFEWLPCEVM